MGGENRMTYSDYCFNSLGGENYGFACQRLPRIRVSLPRRLGAAEGFPEFSSDGRREMRLRG